MMKSAAITAILCYIVAMGPGMALPSEVAHSASESEEFEAQAQYHLLVPVLGCIEVYHYLGGLYYRIYVCDDDKGRCLYSPSVNACTPDALYHQANLMKIVNVRGRNYAVRFYNQIGGACVFSHLPHCICMQQQPCNATVMEGAHAADTGYTKGQAEDCRCVDLPSGERLCDPIDCEGVEMQNCIPYCKQKTKMS